MIDYITGKCTFVDQEMIVIDSGGIGYQIIIGNPYQYSEQSNQEIQVFTYQHVREDVLALYGFSSREERKLFIHLLQVSGVGPKAAVAILAGGTPGRVISAIRNEDVGFLTQFQGIGKKTAQRIVIDLKDKLDDLAPRFSGESHLQQQESPRNKEGIEERHRMLEEASEALLSLGYAEKQVKNIQAELMLQAEDDWDTERLVKLGLQLLMK